MDSFHEAVRHSIRVAWQDPKKRAKLRQMDSGEEAVWSCGASANRLCELLAANDMRTVVGEGVDASKDDDVRDMLQKMKSTYGRLVARVQLRHYVAGHALVWVSAEVTRPHTLEGYIYQTNIGVPTQEYDLIEWINDDKSKDRVHFPAFLAQTQAAFGVNPQPTMAPEDRGAVYEREFLTKGKVVTPSEAKLKAAEGKKVMVMWKAVDDAGALERLGEVTRDA